MKQARTSFRGGFVPPLLPLALLVALVALAIGGGLGGEGPLGPTFSGSGVPDVDAPPPKAEERSRARRTSRRARARRARVARRRVARVARRRLARARTATRRGSPSSVGLPRVFSPRPGSRQRRPPRVRRIPGAPGPTPGGGAGGGGGAPPSPSNPVDRLTDTVRGVVDELPPPLNSSLNQVLDGVLGPR